MRPISVWELIGGRGSQIAGNLCSKMVHDIAQLRNTAKPERSSKSQNLHEYS